MVVGSVDNFMNKSQCWRHLAIYGAPGTVNDFNVNYVIRLILDSNGRVLL